MTVTITEFEKTLASLKEAITFQSQSNETVAANIARDAVIQRFEFCVELAWKVAAKRMESAATTMYR